MVSTLENPIVDDAHFGRLARGARISAGYPSAALAAEALTRFGQPFTERTLQALERGESKPTLAQIAALAVIFKPQGRLEHFYPALRQDVRAYLTEERRQQ